MTDRPPHDHTGVVPPDDQWRAPRGADRAAPSHDQQTPAPSASQLPPPPARPTALGSRPAPPPAPTYGVRTDELPRVGQSPRPISPQPISPQPGTPPAAGGSAAPGPTRKRRSWLPLLVAFLLGGLLVGGGVVIGRLTADESESAVQSPAPETVDLDPAPGSDDGEPSVEPTDDAAADPGDMAAPLDMEQPVAAVASAVSPAVVQVEVGGGLGSGFFYDASGLILTNAHVVDTAQEVNILTADGTVVPGEVVGTYPVADVAVVRVDPARVPRLVVAPLAVGGAPVVGETVVAIGSPFGLDQTVTSGIVSALNVGLGTIGDGFVGMIQSDAAINSGNSGGPLVGIDGRVIGINTAIFSDDGGNDGVAFSIPIGLAKSVADQMVAGEPVEVGLLGVEMGEPSNGQAGAVVTVVTEGSAAAEAGIETGDRIVGVDADPIRDREELFTAIGGRPPGAEVVVSLVRDGDAREVTVVLQGIER